MEAAIPLPSSETGSQGDAKPVLVWLHSGADVWHTIANSHNYCLSDLDQPDATEEERQLSTKDAAAAD